MSRRRTTALVPIAVLAFGVAAAFGSTAGSTAAPRSGPSASSGQQAAKRLGLQSAPKTATLRRGTANPYVSTLPGGVKADYAGWQRLLATKAAKRAGSPSLLAAQRKALSVTRLIPPLVHDEEEPADSNGSNDTRLSAEPVGAFGTGRKDNPRVRILGTTADLALEPDELTAITEDNGQLNRATPTGISGTGAIAASSVLGDGPHGTLTGDGRNDYDFYRLTVAAGQALTVDTRGSAVDTVVAIYDAAGTPLAADDDGAGVFGGPSLLNYPVQKAGTYYVLVAGFGFDSLPPDPNDSGSGEGGNDEGSYQLAISAGPYDTDYYALDLAKGDVVGATVAGSATKLTMTRYDGAKRVGAEQVDASSLYPLNSPLPGGGNTTLAYVAERSGRYSIRVDGPPGRYDVTVEAYRPGSETDTAKQVQTIFLDFDGARVNTGIFGGPGVRTLSPFSAFIAKWGLDRTQEASLIRRITAVVQENLDRDLKARGLNDKLAVKIVNSRNSPDIFGQTNVSRVIVGGTIKQSGIETIGIAQYIDPGNYSHEDTALVLLDVLSDSDPADDASLNYYLKPGSDRARFVTCAIGNVVSHEIGHYLGNYHTDNGDATHNLMDAGGTNFGQNLYGVGPDGIGGTTDDEDVDFRTDGYAPEEGFTGREATLNVSAWALVRGKNVIQP